MADTPTLVRFLSGSELVGSGDDGMPLYRDIILIRLDRPPYLSVQRTATDEDFAEHPQSFALFQKEQAAQMTTYAEGYPLNLWAAVNPAALNMLAARDIVTVEQLAKLNPKDQRMPAEIRELAERAAQLVKLQAGAAKYEVLLRERDGRIEAMKEEISDLRKAVASLQSQNDRLLGARMNTEAAA